MADEQSSMQIPPVDPQNLAMLQEVGTILKGTQIHGYPISEQRNLFREFQSSQKSNPGNDVQKVKINTSHGEVETFLYKPESAARNLPFVYFIHGGGWIIGEAVNWEEFLFDLVQRTQLPVVFPDYTLAPEKRYPTQQEQCLEVLQHVVENKEEFGLNMDKIVIACDSVGAQLTAALSILNHQRSLDLPIIHQVLLHPFIHTASNAKFIENPLTSAAWAQQQFDSYFTETTNRSDILASPGLMTKEQARMYMPPTTVVTSELDGLRDQGEEFAKMLQTAGVPCGVLRALGCIHDVEIFRLARESPTADLIMNMVAGKVRQLLIG